MQASADAVFAFSAVIYGLEIVGKSADSAIHTVNKLSLVALERKHVIKRAFNYVASNAGFLGTLRETRPR